MLTGLFGNRNVARILLFLFVNERVYGAQLQSIFRIPLTPVQKALLRLERDYILKSHYEGKIRVYQFNPAFPLRSELEAMLKRAYTLLPSQEKKNFCFIHKPKQPIEEKSTQKELIAFWEKLQHVRLLCCSVKTHHGEEKSTRIGRASVEISIPTPSIYVFQEKGHWVRDDVAETSFSNSFRWTLDLKAFIITLEHLRYGSNYPVLLFHLSPTRPGILESVDAHLCGDDTYLGNIVWNADRIDFHWRVIGPRKNEELTYHYS